MKKQIGIIVVCAAVLITGGSLYLAEAQDAATLQEMLVDPRYKVPYAPRFFESGGSRAKFDPDAHLRIGIVVRNRTDMDFRYILNSIFETAPLDRYRDFFVFSNADEAMREARQNSNFITTYDSFGRRIGGGFDWTGMRVRAGLVVLDVNDYEWRKSGTLGYAVKETAVTQKSTILHELGHVLGDLGDEYSIGEQEHKKVFEDLMASLGKEYALRMGRGWQQVRENLDYRTSNPLKWSPLIRGGFMPEGQFYRVEIQDEHDIGRFAIPSPLCVMNHPEKSEGRFCPVCQLQLIARIAQYTGCETPWDEYY